ncbi:NACHT domain-containing protein [Streptomyces sp. NPDC003032]
MTPPDEQLDRAADALARAVREQWQSEWRLRRLQDPESLPIHWAPAAAWLSDLDDTIGRPPEDDARRPDLFGRLPEIVQLYELVPSRRLVVLGAPGSGKTVFAMCFTLDLLERRGTGDPVPVLFQASTWQPDRQSLREWLADDLIAAYPTLGTEGTSGSVPARDLVATGRILPVVDGLDEMPPPLRAKAVWRLNTELDADSPLLLTCRSAVCTARSSRPATYSLRPRSSRSSRSVSRRPPASSSAPPAPYAAPEAGAPQPGSPYSIRCAAARARHRRRPGRCC